MSMNTKLLMRKISDRPHALAHQPAVRRQDAGGLATGDEPGDHRREDAAHAERLGRAGRRSSGASSETTISSVGSPVRRQAAVTSQPTTTPTTIPPRPTTTNDTLASTSENAPADGRRDRDPVGDQRRRVVDEALALEDRDDPARHAEPAEDGRRGHRVRRRDDRPERERRGASAAPG